MTQALPPVLSVSPDQSMFDRVRGQLQSGDWFFVSFEQLNQNIVAPNGRQDLPAQIDALFLANNAMIQRSALQRINETTYEIEGNASTTRVARALPLSDSIEWLKANRERGPLDAHDTTRIFKIVLYQGNR